MGPFYPPGLRPEQFLPFYARTFDTAEVNNTFYRLPSDGTFDTWRAQAPEGFVFAVKVSRYITHYAKLKGTSRTDALFYPAVGLLEGHLGPLLYQTPPRWRANPERLDAFLARVPAGHEVAFEFRNPSWFAPEVTEVLARHRAGFCIWHMGGAASPEIVTSDMVYVRLHGPEERYGGTYPDADLDRWAERVRAWGAEGRRVHVYFDNDGGGFAVRDALRLRERLGW